MARLPASAAKQQVTLPLFGVAAALAMVLPSAGLAVVGLSETKSAENSAAFDFFTPASVDPELAARVADKARERGIRFTPAGTSLVTSDRTVTVAVRLDDQTAQAISVRQAVEATPGQGTGIAGLDTSRFNLGTARGYQSFARPQTSPSTTRPSVDVPVSATERSLIDLAMPDLAEFEPVRPSREEEPGRLQPRIALEDNNIAGRSANTLDASEDSVDVGGTFRLSPNLDVTAGVRYSQERDRLDPLTSSVQDSQAVYVGTQIRF